MPRQLSPLPLLLLLVVALWSSVQLVNASALTTTIAANQKTCFYALVDKSGEKVSLPLRRYGQRRPAS